MNLNKGAKKNILIHFWHLKQILGDKVGWFTASYLSKESGRSLLKQMEVDYNVKAKFIHVVRNPFDNIATMAMRLISGLRTAEHTGKVSATGYSKLTNSTLVKSLAK